MSLVACFALCTPELPINYVGSEDQSHMTWERFCSSFIFISLPASPFPVLPLSEKLLLSQQTRYSTVLL